MPNLTLVLGGAASGKSAYAEWLITASGAAPVYLATAQPWDAEMAAKIAAHRAARADNGWRTVEVPLHLGAALAGVGPGDAVLIDCATLWLANLMLAGADLAGADQAGADQAGADQAGADQAGADQAGADLAGADMAGADMAGAEAALMAALAACPAPVVIVSNEVGQGIVPDNALARRFRNAQGGLNRRLAAQAGLVVAVMAGLPLVLKGRLP